MPNGRRLLLSALGALVAWLAALTMCTCVHAQPSAAASAQPSAAASTTSSPATEAAAAPASTYTEPSAEVQAQYRQVAEQAVAEFNAGHWSEARALFLRGHQLWPSARSLRSLGMTSFELRAYARALTELQAALEDPRRPLPEDQRAQVAALVDKTRAFVGRYRVIVSPADAELRIDGAMAAVATDGTVVLDVGRHDVSAAAPGYLRLQRSLDVQGQEDTTLELTLQPTAPELRAAEPAPAADKPPHEAARDMHAAHEAGGSARTWTWISAGTAAALGIASTALWLKSSAEFKRIKSRCDVEVCIEGETDESAFTVPQTAHHITLALALTAGVGAVVLYFVEPGSEVPQSAGLSVGLGSLSMQGQF